MDTVPSRKLTREGAMKVLNAAVDKAQALNSAVSIAVVDDGGHMIAFTRSEKAELYSIAIAQAKAKSAALTRLLPARKVPLATNEMIITRSLSHWPPVPAPLSLSPVAFRFTRRARSSAPSR